MAVVTTTLSKTHPPQLRPFDSRRDLEAVADLIEFSFSATLDPDGRRYLRQMRSLASRKTLYRWSSMASGSNVLPISGFVWEEAGKVVGNLSLVPFFHRGKRINLVANVAVYPEYRRRGIARALTTTALEKSRNRHASATWLQVRHDNQAAIDLYAGLGFEERACRTTWVATPESLQGDFESERWAVLRRACHWSRQKAWLDQNYPPPLRWYFPLRMSAMKPGIWAAFNFLFNEVEIYHWAVEQTRELLGVLSWQRARGYADHLWLAAPAKHEDRVLRTVIPFIRRDRGLTRPITLDYEQGRAVETLTNAGFNPKVTLIWMEVKHNR